MLRTNQEIKRIVQCALKSEFGFAPALSAITIHKSSVDGTHVLFLVDGRKYRFDGHELIMGGMNTVYVGVGTIRRGWTS
jgi:hypothetical protein